MGQQASSLDPKRGADLACVTSWELHDVQGVYARARHLLVPTTLLIPSGDEYGTLEAAGWCINGTLSQFCEVFIGPNLIAPPDQPVLPMSFFALFAETPPGHPDHPPAANFLELMLMLALFCKGAINAQAELCFQMFDADQSNAICKPEMTGLLFTLARGAWRLGLLSEPPDATMVRATAATMFQGADDDRSQSLNAEEFVDWVRVNAESQRIVHALHTARFSSAVSTTLPSAAMKKHIHVQSRLGLDAVVDYETPAAKTDDDKRPDDHSRVVAEHRNAVQKKIANQRVMDRLSSVTMFTSDELRRLRRRYNAVGRGSPLTRNQFMTLVSSEYKALRHADISSLFNAFDQDKNGLVDFREFATGISSLTKGTLSDKLQFLFEVYDQNGDGVISASELARYALNGPHDTAEALTFARDMLLELGFPNEQGAGAISRDKFFRALANDTVLCECFMSSMLSPGRTNIFLTQEDAEEPMQYNLRLLKEIWSRCGRHPHGSMGKRQFRQFMMDDFKVPGECSELLNRLFDLFDTDHLGAIGWRELFVNLAKANTSSLSDKAALYFQLFDVDGTGVMERAEVEHMLYATQTLTDGDNSGRIALDMLSSAGGRITLAEFQQAIRAQPSLLRAFGRLFHGSGMTPSGELSVTASLHRDLAEHAVGAAMHLLLIAMSKRPKKHQESHHSSAQMEEQVREQVRRLPLSTATQLVTKLQDETTAGLESAHPATGIGRRRRSAALKASLVAARLAAQLRKKRYSRCVASLAAIEHGKQLTEDLAGRMVHIRKEKREEWEVRAQLSARMRELDASLVQHQLSAQQLQLPSLPSTVSLMTASKPLLAPSSSRSPRIMSPRSIVRGLSSRGTLNTPSASYATFPEGFASPRVSSPRSVRLAASAVPSSRSPGGFKPVPPPPPPPIPLLLLPDGPKFEEQRLPTPLKDLTGLTRQPSAAALAGIRTARSMHIPARRQASVVKLQQQGAVPHPPSAIFN